MSKYITLKNGLRAELHLDKSKNTFHLYATAGSYKKVGFCTFTLSYKIEKTLTDQERLDYANKHNIRFEKTPTKLYKIVHNCDIEKIENGFIKLKKGKIYKIAETSCHLDKIEIIDEKFFKVGLGSTFIKAMEIIIAKYDCSHIEGLFAPFGKFQSGTEAFYDRNNFQIIEDPELYGIKQLYKKCEPKKLNSEI